MDPVTHPFSPATRSKIVLGVQIALVASVVLGAIFRILMAVTGAPPFEYLTGIAAGAFLLGGSSWFWLAAVSPQPGKVNVIALVYNFMFAFILLTAGVWVITRGILELFGR